MPKLHHIQGSYKNAVRVLASLSMLLLAFHSLAHAQNKQEKACRQLRVEEQYFFSQFCKQQQFKESPMGAALCPHTYTFSASFQAVLAGYFSNVGGIVDQKDIKNLSAPLQVTVGFSNDYMTPRVDYLQNTQRYPDQFDHFLILGCTKESKELTVIGIRVRNLTGKKETQVVLPSSISRLANLSLLHLEGLGLRELPASISQLEKLSFVSLKNNAWSSFPPQPLEDLMQLEVLDLSSNPIQIISDLGGFDQLKLLILKEIKIDVESSKDILPEANLIGDGDSLPNLSQIKTGEKIQELDPWRY
ncbi:MAG: leucine-rich repeat domain-containing protein [Bdellovibrionales bacterium]|nr:leucine-rich repeat domain-containing protein [Bdellovibrionales bacterium]